MTGVLRRNGLAASALALCALLASGCGYNTLVSEGEAVDGAWGEVQNQLQRRNDLVPNLVETVKGFAKQEQEVFVKVTEARSRVARRPRRPPMPSRLRTTSRTPSRASSSWWSATPS